MTCNWHHIRSLGCHCKLKQAWQSHLHAVYNMLSEPWGNEYPLGPKYTEGRKLFTLRTGSHWLPVHSGLRPTTHCLCCLCLCITIQPAVWCWPLILHLACGQLGWWVTWKKNENVNFISSADAYMHVFLPSMHRFWASLDESFPIRISFLLLFKVEITVHTPPDPLS